MADTKKTVLITGSTRGIGLALVEHYTKTDWNVIATSLDVPIDLLTNNVGIAQPTTFATTTKDSLMQQLEVNVTGPFLVTPALSPNVELAVKTRGKAVVLQVSSVVGSISHNKEENAHLVRGHYGYVTSKAA
ncbi:hypothetical protein JG688_00018020 [Phytophthora aleatoria]|uniref:Short chain dehydrogenase n=1 Tax=Phytophthora aleatoria TaxID=2496075 RepID=A0A8J5IQ45_9STRA|nr:hypothetical protein JG688_00018020 [Phytophthora aleatoria]